MSLRLRLVVGFLSLLVGVLGTLVGVDLVLGRLRHDALLEARDHLHLRVQGVVVERALMAALAAERGADAETLTGASRALDQALNQSQWLYRVNADNGPLHVALEAKTDHIASEVGRLLRAGAGATPGVVGLEQGLLATTTLVSDQELADVAERHLSMRSMDRVIRGAGLVLAFAVVALGLWIVPPFVRRVNHLRAVTEQLSAGQFGVRTHLSGAGDLASLGRALDDLSARLLTTRETVAAQRDLLETRNRLLDAAVTQLAGSQDAMMKSARAAGMAELAAGVLHNIGNVINGVSVAADTLSGRLKTSKVGGVEGLAKVLREQDDVVAFMAGDPRGQQLIPYLGALGRRLLSERDANLSDLRALRDRVEHIVRILQMQQAYAVQGGLVEDVPVAPLIEEALLVGLGTTSQSTFCLSREVEPGCVAKLDRHRTLAILVNFLRNAVWAVREEPAGELTVGARRVGDQVTLWVRDNGGGVADDVRDKVFTHGFTTRVGGHGFGLHASANAAREMGADVGFESAGEGCGATFFLTTPAGSAVSDGGRTDA